METVPPTDAPDGVARRPRVVIVGAGFAGLECARALAGAACDVTVLDRENHHCFQPLLYQVAVAALAPGDVAWPIRALLRRAANVRVVMAEATGIDREAAVVRTASGADFPYDRLVVATGAGHAYFGHDDWARVAPGLKRAEDAVDIRRRLLCAFEAAETAPTPETRAAHLTFVVVGGGPTGVEMAGAIADLARDALPDDFRAFDPRDARVMLVEAGPRLLQTFPDRLATSAARALARRGVEVLTGRPVTDISAGSIRIGDEVLAAGTVLWAAGVRASPAADWPSAPHDRAGRVGVGEDLRLPSDPSVFVVGDTAAASLQGRPVPGLAPAAKQMGRHVARTLIAELRGRPGPGPFRYRHQGDLATIGRGAAVVKLGRLELTGWPGWLFWSLVHVYFLIGARNRIAVAFSWAWDYLTFGRKARLILHPPAADPV